jgi:hypothetical protein
MLYLVVLALTAAILEIRCRRLPHASMSNRVGKELTRHRDDSCDASNVKRATPMTRIARGGQTGSGYNQSGHP